MIKRVLKLDNVVLLLGGIALVISCIMGVKSISGGTMVGCGLGSGCDNILNSSWSKLFGHIPVAAAAAVMYIVLLACILLRNNVKIGAVCRPISLLCIGCITGAAIWFTYIQAFIEHSFCQYCMTVHSLGAIVSVLVVVLLKNNRRWMFVLLGMVAALGLALFQIATKPSYYYEKGHLVEELPRGETIKLPVVGSLQAENIITLLYDYQCFHCYHIHRLIPLLVGKYPDKIAFRLVTLPISPECNPYMAATGEDEFSGSCELSKLALALWFYGEDTFYSYDAWMYEHESGLRWKARTIEEAKEKAASLVGGKDRLQVLLNAERVDDILSHNYELYRLSTAQGAGAVPCMIHGTTWAVPVLETESGLINFLKEIFGIVME